MEGGREGGKEGKGRKDVGREGGIEEERSFMAVSYSCTCTCISLSGSVRRCEYF